MKIVCVIGAFSRGGAERVMTNLVNYLCEEHEVTLITIVYRDEIPYAIDDRVKIVNGLKYRNKISAMLALRKEIQENSPQLVLSFLVEINILTILASCGLGIPVVISERNDPSRNCNVVRAILRKLTYPLASGYVFQTKNAKDYFSAKIQKKSIIIPNPFFVDDKDLDYRPIERKNEIVAVGRLIEQKNHQMLISAFTKIISEFENYNLLIYGEGAQKKLLQSIIDKNGARDRIFLCGGVNNIHECIRDSRIFVMTSDFEGMPNALMEAMALGLCCISTDCPVGGPRELIVNGKNGLLIPVNDVNALVDSLKRVIKNPDECARLGNSARQIRVDFNPSKIFVEWEKYLICIIEQFRGN